MSNVLGICGSPIRDGSTDILVREVLRGAQSREAAIDYVFLNDLQIMPCQACGTSPEEGYCFFHDGMDGIYEKFDRCDAIVVGSPVYFDSVSAQTKLFIDRTNCFRTMAPDDPGKFAVRITEKRRGVIVLVGGERETYEPARLVIGGFFVWAGITPSGLITFAHDGFEKGAVAEDHTALSKAFEAGAALVE
ncbi:MAG: flavodoxin family protein [candidate division Zixibacteria bacterium]|nr:flavodoxin family protein [candidate division Zixibacteria bacterium]